MSKSIILGGWDPKCRAVARASSTAYPLGKLFQCQLNRGHITGTHIYQDDFIRVEWKRTRLLGRLGTRKR